VRKAAYLGSHMEYGLALDGMEPEIFVVDGNVGQPHAVDARVGVGIDPSGAAIIPSSGDQS
jgi:iron(III) transport system ATP-binding protein